MKFDLGARPFDSGGERCGEAIDRGHRANPAKYQREPPVRHGIGAHEIRGSVEAVGQQATLGEVDRGVRLTRDDRLLCRVDERHLGEGVQHLSV